MQAILRQLPTMREVYSRMFTENAPLDFTVAICTYNGAGRIPDVLECLYWQLNTEDIAWEVVVIDNNSTDNTAEVIQSYQAKWPHAHPLRYAFEKKQGAGYARHKAMHIARSPLVGFLDDDNLPSMTWVSAAFRFAQEHPQAGVFGSRIRGDFEINPPANFERIAAFLALTERGDQPILYYPEKKILPPGAGLVVRRDPWLQHVPEQPVLGGRAGKSMLTGEDLEAVLHIQRAGWQIWYNPAMRLYHKIPEHRLKREYLVSLMRGIGLSRHRTRMLSVSPWQRPFMFLLYQLNDVRKLLGHVLKYRTAVYSDTVTACEMTLYVFSLISPYYLWQRALQKVWQQRELRLAPPSEAI